MPGMTISLPGLLKRAGNAADAVAPELGYGFMLDELLDHLRELRTRYRAGETDVVEEFFALYAFHGPRQPFEKRVQ